MFLSLEGISGRHPPTYSGQKLHPDPSSLPFWYAIRVIRLGFFLGWLVMRFFSPYLLEILSTETITIIFIQSILFQGIVFIFFRVSMYGFCNRIFLSVGLMVIKTFLLFDMICGYLFMVGSIP